MANLDIMSFFLNAPEPEEEFRAVPKQVTKNAEALSRGDFPEGVDVDSSAMIAAIEELQTMSSSDQAANRISKQIEQGIIRMQDTRTRSRALLNELETNMGEQRAVLDQATPVQAEIAQAELAEDLTIEFALKDTINKEILEQEELEQGINENAEVLLQELEAMQEFNSLSPMDLIKNPINFFKARMRASAAQANYAVAKERHNVLTGISDANHTLAQRHIGNAQLTAELRTRSLESKYIEEQGINSVMNAVTAKRAIIDNDVKAMAEAFNMDQEYTSTLVSALNAQGAISQLRRQDVQNALDSVRLKYTKDQMDQATKIMERDEAARQVVEERLSRYNEINPIFPEGVPITMEGWQNLVENGMISAEQAYLVSTFSLSGLNGTQAVVESPNAYRAYQARVMVDGAASMPQGLNTIMAKLPSLAVGGDTPLAADQEFRSMNLQEREVALSNRFQEIVDRSRSDVDVLLHRNMGIKNASGANIVMSPHTFTEETYRAIGMPVAAREAMADWKLPTSSYGEWLESALDKGAGLSGFGGGDLEQLAEGIAAVSKLFQREAEEATGFVLGGMSTTTGGTVLTPVIDGTNPAHIYQALVARRSHERLGTGGPVMGGILRTVIPDSVKPKVTGVE